MKINPKDHEGEFLDKLQEYQGSGTRRYRRYTEEIFRKGRKGDFIIDTSDIDGTITNLQNLIENLDYTLYPPVMHAYQNFLDCLLNEYPEEKRALEEIRDGISPSEFPDVESQNPLSKSMKEKKQDYQEKIIDPKVLEEVLEGLPDYKEMMLRTLYDTGCRIGEVVAIEKRDLDFESENASVEIHLRRSHTQEDGIRDTLKINDERWVLAGTESKKLLKNHIEENNLSQEDFLFFPKLARGTVKMKIRKLTRSAFREYSDHENVPEKVKPHNMRHTRATELVKKHGQKYAQEYLGHKNITSTEVYSHLDVKTDILREISGFEAYSEKEIKQNNSNKESAKEILEKRYAKGEIDTDEFKRRMDTLSQF